MCQNEPDNRNANQNNPSQSPGREDPSLNKQQGAQRQPGIPGRDEDEDVRLADEGGEAMDRNKQGQGSQRRQDAEAQQRDVAGGQNINGD